MSDALKIALWCWREVRWTEGEDGRAYSADHTQGWPRGLDDIADAERLMVSRGHGERYGRALIEAVSKLPPIASGSAVIVYGDAARIRTLPPETIRAALARVIDELKELETKA